MNNSENSTYMDPRKYGYSGSLPNKFSSNFIKESVLKEKVNKQ